MDETLRYTPPEPSQVPLLEPPKWWHRITRKTAFMAGIVPATVLLFLILVALSAPKGFPIGAVYTIEKGETLSSIATGLEQAHIVKSARVLKALVRAFAPRSGALAGDYEFSGEQNAAVVAWRIAYGAYDLSLERITIPEGLTAVQIAALFAKDKKFSAFDPAEFEKAASGHEGYLFPDTYLFLPNVTADQVVSTMLKTYSKRIAPLVPDMEKSGRSASDIVTMASILEEEGRTDNTRKIIAGILWKRLDLGMPLQVDASIVYLSKKKSGNYLTSDDFKTVSPYNTYLNKGLPPAPISNPGLAAIQAAMSPISSRYYFYLTDANGGFWPAVTYEEHLANKAKYLK